MDSDFSNELQNILDEQFAPDQPKAVWCSDITDMDDGYFSIRQALYICFPVKLLLGHLVGKYASLTYREAIAKMQRNYSKKRYRLIFEHIEAFYNTKRFIVISISGRKMTLISYMSRHR